MTSEDLISNHPELYHVTATGSWCSIKKHGLCTTNDLLNRAGVTLSCPAEGQYGRLDNPAGWREMQDGQTSRIGWKARDTGARVCSDDPESSLTAIIRDQDPLNGGSTLESQLEHQGACITLEEWHERQNDRVFFFPTEKAAKGFAKTYQGKNAPQDILVVCTKSLINEHRDQIELSAYNSGSTEHQGEDVVSKNGLEKWHDELFVPLGEYNFDYWRLKKGGPKKAVVEVTVKGGVPDILAHVVKVVQMNGSEEGCLLHKRYYCACPLDCRCVCCSMFHQVGVGAEACRRHR